MTPTAQCVAIVNQFYRAFAKKNAEVMSALYSIDVAFSDPVFQSLRGSEAGDMWKMLCSRSTDLQITHEVVGTGDHTVFVKWEARYTFTGTGRKVLNRVHATLTIKDDKISKHQDRFDFWVWSRQALGPVGYLLGWSPWLKNNVRAQASTSLKKFRTAK